MANNTTTYTSEKDMDNTSSTATPWEVIAFRLINTACRDAAVAHAKILRAKRVKHAFYGLDQRAHFVESHA